MYRRRKIRELWRLDRRRARSSVDEYVCCHVPIYLAKPANQLSPLLAKIPSPRSLADQLESLVKSETLIRMSASDKMLVFRRQSPTMLRLDQQELPKSSPTTMTPILEQLPSSAHSSSPIDRATQHRRHLQIRSHSRNSSLLHHTHMKSKMKRLKESGATFCH